MALWETIADIKQPIGTNNVTSVLINNLNITGNDVYKMHVANVNSNTGSNYEVDLFINGRQTNTGYNSSGYNANGGSESKFTLLNNNYFWETERDSTNFIDFDIVAHEAAGVPLVLSRQNSTTKSFFGARIAEIAMEDKSGSLPITSLEFSTSVNFSENVNSDIKLFKMNLDPIVDLTLDSNVGSIDLSNLNIQREEEYQMIITAKNQATAGSFFFWDILINDDTNKGNYYPLSFLNHSFIGRGEEDDTSSTYAMRVSDDASTYITANFRLTKDGYFVVDSKSIRNINSSINNFVFEDIMLVQNKIGNINSIDKITLAQSLGGYSMLAGSNIKLYKLT